MQLNTDISPNLVSQTMQGPSSGWLDRLRTRWRARLRGRLPEIRSLSEAVGVLRFLRYLTPAGSPESRLSSLLLAFRRTRSPLMLKALGRAIRPWLSGAHRGDVTRRVGWGPYEYVRAQAELPTSLILKEPQPGGEKGVLYISFEYNLMRLLAHYDARRVLSDYLIVGASSWSPTDFSVFANFAGLSDDPLFMGISNRADVPVYNTFRPVVEALPILASEWINPVYYAPKPHAAREIDILMVANWLTFKRHWMLFDALRHMRRGLRVVLVGIGSPQTRTEQAVRDEARAFGAPADVEFVNNAHIDTVSALQCNAKVSVLFSRREGSCVATAEAMFAGSPVAMSRAAHVGSKAYINDQTGVLVDEHHVARDLSAFLERSGEFRPREWALANISCHQSSTRLNEFLRDYSLRANKPWTKDITPMCWRYVPSYMDAQTEVAMQPAVERLQRDHGVILKKFEYRPPKAAN